MIVRVRTDKKPNFISGSQSGRTKGDGGGGDDADADITF